MVRTGCLWRGLQAEGVDLSGIKRIEGPSGLAMIAVEASGENQIIVVSGANDKARAAQVEGLLGPHSLLVTQNEVPWSETQAAHRAAKDKGARVIHNAAPAHGLSDAALAKIDILVVNEHELDAAAACTGSDDEKAQALLQRGAGALVLTLGAAGARVYQAGDQTAAIPAAQATVVDTTGAGDGFVGALAAALAEDQALPEAGASGQCLRRAGLRCSGRADTPRLSQLIEIEAGLTEQDGVQRPIGEMITDGQIEQLTPGARVKINAGEDGFFEG